MSNIKVLFVCSGNICRSPTAEAVLRRHAQAAGLGRRILADSAGTLDYHAGAPPDRRAQLAAQRRGYDLRTLRARQVKQEDFSRFDYLLGLAEEHARWLRDQAPPAQAHKVGLLLDYAPALGRRDVPDPYFGASEGFEVVLDLIERASEALLTELQRELTRRGQS
jgi:protein-tyrosine phosphatase